MGVRTPDIYIIGMQKSGTTTLYNWLAQHPEIYAHPLAKDHPYFCNNQTYNDGPEIFYSFAKNAHDNQQVLGGEANALYAPCAPQRMYDMMPNTKLIAILRNPVDRAFSAYCYAVERLLENRSLEQAIDDELDGLQYEPEDSLQRDYLAHGQYAQQLKILYQFFDASQVKVIFFEELKKEPLEVLKKIFRFINISEFVPKLSIKNQTKGGSRSKILAQIIHRNPSSKLVRIVGRKIIPFSIRTGFRRKLVAINRIEQQQPEFPDHTKKILREYYKKEISELQLLIDDELPEWR